MMRILAFIGFVITLAGGSYWLYKQQLYTKEPAPPQVSIQEVMEQRKTAQEAPTGEEAPEALPPEESADPAAAPPDEPGAPLPESLNLAAVFYPQAPFANWDYPWQEACEEASVLLVANAYYEHNWTREEFNEQILALVDWQNEVFGDYIHTDMEQTARILEEYLGLETVMHEDPTFEDVQKILARGHLIVMPFAGKMLGNPNFRNGGPIYHVVMVKGYTEDGKIVTHDVGTRRGENYVYSWDVLRNALHDYSPDHPIEQGAKRFLEVLPPAPASPEWAGVSTANI